MAHEEPAVSLGTDVDAPGRLGVVQAFVNTVQFPDVEATEHLTDGVATTAWCRAAGLLPDDDQVDDADVPRLRGFREGLRDLLAANHDAVDASDETLAALDRAAGTALVRFRVGADGTSLVAAGSGGDRVIAGLLVLVHDAMREGTWRRLKACRSDTCRWAMWDASRNRSGKWCDMAVCGNRNKARAYRERHAAG